MVDWMWNTQVVLRPANGNGRLVGDIGSGQAADGAAANHESRHHGPDIGFQHVPATAI